MSFRPILVALLLMLAIAPAGTQELLLTTHRFDPIQGEPDLEPGMRAADPAPGEASYYLVQLSGPVTDENRNALGSRGLHILHYIPDYAFLVRGTSEAAGAARSMQGIRWVGLYHPAYKLDPAIGSHEFRIPERASDPWLWLVVRVHEPDDARSVAIQLADMGGIVTDVVIAGNKRVLVRMPPERLPDVARLQEVLYVAENGEYFVQNNTTRWVIQSNTSGNTGVWNHGLHGENQLLAEMDSGVDWQSCFFRDPEGDAIGSDHRKIQSYTTYGGGAAYDGCDDGHGSHVAGTLLGNDFTGANSAYNGMAYQSRLVFQDIGADDFISCFFGAISAPSALTTAYQNAYNAGARIHTNSWGGQNNEYNAYAEDIDAFMWSNRDLLVFFAMGNAGPSAGTIGYPATAKDCVSVGGTQQASTRNNMYVSSSRGPCYDNRRKPDVCALADGANGGPPDIWSCDNSPASSPTCAVVGSGWNGTSMATPAVTGCAALVRQYFVEGYSPLGVPIPANGFAPTAALVKATLIAGGEPMTGSGISAYPDNNQGWGRLLLDKALFFSGDDIGQEVVDNTAGLSTGGSYSRQAHLGSTQPARFVLVWSDPSKAPPASPPLVNNLNLRVTDPLGNVYLGNVFSGGQSATGGSADGINNVEVVHRNSPTAGIWTVEAIGQNVPTGPQPFAVVITGAGLNVPVSLSSFSATYHAEVSGVVLQWETASQEDNLGFFVERCTALGEAYARLNSDVIPGAGTTTTSHTYRFVDRAVEEGTYYYRLVQIDADGTTATHGPVTVTVGIGQPQTFSLGPALPNPFDETLTITYSIPSPAPVRLAVYDLHGRLVRVLVDRVQDAARHRVLWDGRDQMGGPVAAGQYVYRLTNESFVATGTVVLIK